MPKPPQKLPTDQPPWGARETVVLEGGPRDGWWYFADEWEAHLRSRRHQDLPVTYSEAAEFRGHPDYATSGRIWRHTNTARSSA